MKARHRRTQATRNTLQSLRHSTSYDPRDNNRITQTSRDALQSARHSTSYDPRDNNRSIEGCQNQERQVVNASTRGTRGNNFGSRILNFFARRKKMMYVVFKQKICELIYHNIETP
jgi:hypothetical protein